MLVLVGIVLLAVNLRPAAVSVGPVLQEIQDGLGLGSTGAGLLTALPVISFGLFGALAPLAAHRIGMHRLTLVALLALCTGLVLRSMTGSAMAFLLLTVLALAGLATSNVLLPSLVKLHFPQRVGALTAAYTTAMAVGLTTASVATVPVSDQWGSWRWGLGLWSVTALIAAVPWIGLIRHDVAYDGRRRTVRLSSVARTRLGWALALLFGFQSLQAYTAFGWMAQIYRDAGFTATEAGLLLGVVTGVSIPVSLVVPPLAARLRDQTGLLLGLLALYPVGYAGLILAPEEGALAWALLIGLAAGGVFPLVLTLIGLRSRTAEGTAALSGFAQSTGYAVAALGPFGTGLLHDLTGDWTWPLLALTAVALGAAALAPAVARPRHIEDDLERTG